VVFLLVVLSIGVVLLPGDWIHNAVNTSFVGQFDTGFWQLYALFFPAVTGLMAGIGLSGELSNPRKQIPQGVISATLITTILYIVMVFRLGQATSANELVANTMIMVDYASSSLLVLIGIL
jgi:amino acid transporter